MFKRTLNGHLTTGWSHVDPRHSPSQPCIQPPNPNLSAKYSMIRCIPISLLLLCGARQISSWCLTSGSKLEKAVRLFSYNDKGNSNGNGNGEADLNMLESSGWYSEHKPRRLVPTKRGSYTESTPMKAPDFEDEWGLERGHDMEFPAALSDVVDHAFAAIAGTLYQTRAPDPNIASNAMSRSIFTHRPTLKATDAGRIGLEIDGIEHLFRYPYRVSSAAATRRMALLLRPSCRALSLGSRSRRSTTEPARH